jgi:hypothetical protein
MSEIKTRINVGDTVYWIHHSNKVYKGIVEGMHMCEGQGAIYCSIHSPMFKINPYPNVHYSFCYKEKERAVEASEYLKQEEESLKRCDRCKLNSMGY